MIFHKVFILLIAIMGSILVIADEVILETSQGKLLGITAGKDNNKISIYKGIPYAVPPIGNRRWKPPEPALSWQGIRHATSFGPACMQKSIHDMGTLSEDCLSLNIWTGGKIDKKRPVMVWIHGGGQKVGAGSLARFDGTALAKKGVVLVTINYRLNVFGYFAHPELSAESPNGVSGNYGLRDQIQALKWVRENIAAFGGDPDNITIFGVSGGADGVKQLLASPLAHGLFHRAIAQSGTSFTPIRLLKKSYMGEPSAETIGHRFGEKINAPSLAELRDIPARKITEQWWSQGDSVVGPDTLLVVDGWSLPDQIYSIFDQGKQSDVPVILGFTADEATGLSRYGFVPPVPMDAAHYRAEVRGRYGELANDYISVYPADNIEDSVFNSVRDGAFGWGAQTWAKMTQNVSSKAYLYLFDHEPPWATGKTILFQPGNQQRRLGASHGAEVLYVFNTLQMDAETVYSQNIHNHMMDVISDYWVAFATNGIPDVKGLPVWKSYTDKSRNYMSFNDGNGLPSSNLYPGASEVYNKINAKRWEAGIFWSNKQNSLNGFIKKGERKQ